MSHNEVQGLFGEELLDLIAAAVGCTTATPSRDRGWDRLIQDEHDDLPIIAAQVKTSRALVSSGANWKYRLDRDTYNRLVGKSRILKLFVLVKIVPTTKAYLTVEKDGIRVGCVPYWARFESAPKLGGHQQTKTVSVPQENILKPQVLRKLSSEFRMALEAM